MIHRNELIDPKWLAREGGVTTLKRLTDGHHVDLVGSGHLMVRASMLRGAHETTPATEGNATPEVLGRIFGRKLGPKMAGGNLKDWGTPYHRTRRSAFFEPTFDSKKKRWDRSTAGVWFQATPDLPEILLGEHYVWALWPWITSEGFSLRWDGEPYTPAVICDCSTTRDVRGNALGSIAYPMAIVMPMYVSAVIPRLRKGQRPGARDL